MVSKTGPLCITTFISHVGPSLRVTRVMEGLVGLSRTRAMDCPPSPKWEPSMMKASWGWMGKIVIFPHWIIKKVPCGSINVGRSSFQQLKLLGSESMTLVSCYLTYLGSLLSLGDYANHPWALAVLFWQYKSYNIVFLFVLSFLFLFILFLNMSLFLISQIVIALLHI